MCEALPVGMLTRLSALGSDLAQWASEHRDASLAQHEQAVLDSVRAALPELLGAVLQAATTTLDARARPVRERCPTCDQRVRVQSWRPRQVHTVCGSVRVERPWYVCRACHHGWSPADATLGVAAHSRLSAGLRAHLVQLGAATTFVEAARLLQQLTGQHVAPETVRQHTAAAGTALEQRQQQQMTTVAATQASAEPVDPAPATLVVEADGVMVRYIDGWHEAKVGLAASWDGQRAEAASYVAAREGPERFGPRLLAEAARRGALDVIGYEQPAGVDPRLAGVSGPSLAMLRPVVVVGDGAPWIWGLAAEHFGTRTEIVDWYHASEHLWKLGRALHGDGTATTTAWVRHALHLLWFHGPEPVLALLRTTPATTPEATEALRLERGFFTTNASRMQYPRFRRQGLPVGSGAVESAAKHLVQHRLKRPGARWSVAGAQALLTLRAHLSSGRPLPCAA